MSIPNFWIKKGDTGPPLQVLCEDETGDPIDVTGATVKFSMQDESSVNKISLASGNVVDGPIGKIEYVWQAVDTDTEGIYFGEFRVTFSGGEIITFPNYTYIVIKVHAVVA